jgi:ketosteroid isomerase-like protein
MNKKIALDFVNAINAHDVNKIIALMADDHVFIDAYGNSEGKEVMKQGWPDYFSWFPDYSIEIDDVLASGDMIVLLGHAGGTYRGKTAYDGKNHWHIPAAWRAIVENRTVKVWQVYADSKIPFDIMND